MPNDITDSKANLQHELEDLVFGSVKNKVNKNSIHCFILTFNNII